VTKGRINWLQSHSRPFWALTCFLISAFLLGGASRAEEQSVIILRPLSVLFLGYGLHGLTSRQVREFQFLFAMAAALIAWVAIQLIPLPPAVWSALPGRELIVRIDDAAELHDVWRPLSLSPAGTRNALFSLISPLAVLVLGARLDRDERPDMLWVILGLGLLSGIIAVLQISGPNDSFFYFYRVTNNGSAVGLFANRNHHAIFLAALFPALAAFAAFETRPSTSARLRRIMAIALGTFLVPLILVTGSRAGLLVAILSLLGIPLVSRRKTNGLRRGFARPIIWASAIAAIAAMAMLTIKLGPGGSVRQVRSPFARGRSALQGFQPIVAMAWHYFPAGAGFGAFRQVFQIDEPYEMLATTHFYHAHNDWLEAVLTGGLPAIVALGIAIAAYAVGIMRLQAARHVDSNGFLARAGAWVLLLFSAASISDYPLRVPSIACLFVIAAMWMNSVQTPSIAQKGD
jgi:O-antigen ligase